MDIQQQKSFKALLIGDSCLDYYHFGICERLSPEAPVPVLKEEKVIIKGGMSLNVKNNLESFGMNVHHLTNSKMIEKHRLVDQKTNYQIVRFDVNESLRLPELDLAGIKAEDYECLVISDYCKGSISDNIARIACDLFINKPVFVDSKKRDLSCFSNCYIKINEKEKNAVIRNPIDSSYIVTLGQNGTYYNNKIYQTKKVEVFDVCGAGDVFLSSLVYYYTIFGSIEKSILQANRFATRSVTKFGTYTITQGDIDDFCI